MSLVAVPCDVSRFVSRGNRGIHPDRTSLGTLRDISVSLAIKVVEADYRFRQALPAAGFASL